MNGDTTRCPQCGGLMEFNERFRFDRGMTPAWVCENTTCSVKRFPARRADALSPIPKALVRLSKDLRARALRVIMMSKARVARTRNGLGRD